MLMFKIKLKAVTKSAKTQHYKNVINYCIIENKQVFLVAVIKYTFVVKATIEELTN